MSAISSFSVSAVSAILSFSFCHLGDLVFQSLPSLVFFQSPSRKELHQTVPTLRVSVQTPQDRGASVQYRHHKTEGHQYRHHKIERHQYRHHKIEGHQYRHHKIERHQYRHHKIEGHQYRHHKINTTIKYRVQVTLNNNNNNLDASVQTPQGQI